MKHQKLHIGCVAHHGSDEPVTHLLRWDLFYTIIAIGLAGSGIRQLPSRSARQQQPHCLDGTAGWMQAHLLAGGAFLSMQESKQYANIPRV